MTPLGTSSGSTRLAVINNRQWFLFEFSLSCLNSRFSLRISSLICFSTLNVRRCSSSILNVNCSTFCSNSLQCSCSCSCCSLVTSPFFEALTSFTSAAGGGGGVGCRSTALFRLSFVYFIFSWKQKWKKTTGQAFSALATDQGLLVYDQDKQNMQISETVSASSPVLFMARYDQYTHTVINRVDFVSWWMWFNGLTTKVQRYFLTNAFCYLRTYITMLC